MLNDNIKVIKNQIVKLIIKKDDNFNIPVQFIEYSSDGKLKVTCLKNYKKLLYINKEYLIESSLFREVSVVVFNYFI